MPISPEAFLCEKDHTLREIIESIQKPVIESTDDVFFDLVTCITDQQIHYRSQGSYAKKLMELIDDRHPSPELILTLDPHEFAIKKISGMKYKALINLAGYWEQNKLQNVNWHSLSDEKVRTTLLPIKGIGEWTIDMILLFTLGRQDIFNPQDFQLKKVMRQCYGIADGPSLKQEMTYISEQWIPYRSLAVTYLLGWKNYLKKR